jgi:hypothetical protein
LYGIHTIDPYEAQHTSLQMLLASVQRVTKDEEMTTEAINMLKLVDALLLHCRDERKVDNLVPDVLALVSSERKLLFTRFCNVIGTSFRIAYAYCVLHSRVHVLTIFTINRHNSHNSHT